MPEIYEFNVSPDYATATYYGPRGECVHMDEWSGRFAEFSAGMDRKAGFRRQEPDVFESSSGRRIVTHRWVRQSR